MRVLPFHRTLPSPDGGRGHPQRVSALSIWTATVLVTGADRGLGLEFTRQYAARGDTVIAICRHPEDAAELHALAAGCILIPMRDEPIVALWPLNRPTPSARLAYLKVAYRPADSNANCTIWSTRMVTSRRWSHAALETLRCSSRAVIESSMCRIATKSYNSSEGRKCGL